MTKPVSKIPAYKSSKLAAVARVKDLLARMTLAEKAAQMVGVWQEKSTKLVDASGNFDLAKAKVAFKKGHGLGQVGRPSDSGANPATSANGQTARGMAELTNAIQKFFLEHSRLGIPVMFHEECLHGHAAKDGISFPQPIGLGATFNPALVEKLYAMTAHETRVRGGHQALTPVVDVGRDARWGRVEETYGEDPFLNTQFGIAAVRGFQGDGTFKNKNRVIATLKHFAAHGQPESGQNCAPVNVSERVLRETFLHPFRDYIKKAVAISVMASYNEIDGVPSHASRWLLRYVLRKEWGFKGFVVSDYYAIWELGNRSDTHGHFVAANKADLRACCESGSEHRITRTGLLFASCRAGEEKSFARIGTGRTALENPAKRDGAVALVKKLQAAGIHLTAIGSQTHARLDWPTTQQVDAMLLAFAPLGVNVNVTELDIDVLPAANGNRSADVEIRIAQNPKLNPYPNGLPDSVQAALDERYAELFAVFVKYSSLVDSVTFWGVTDGNSWLNDWPVHGRTSYPLLFDRAGKPKSAYLSVIKTAAPAKSATLNNLPPTSVAAAKLAE